MNNTDDKKRKMFLNLPLAIISIILFAGVIIACLNVTTEYNGFHIDNCKEITSGFSVVWGDNRIYTSLPATIENNNAETVYISKVLHKDELGKGDSLLFRNRQGRALVYLDNVLIYDSGEVFANPFPLGYGSFYKSVHIGSDYDGKTLTIRIEPGYNMKAVTGYIPSVYWGSQASFIKMVFEKSLITQFLSMFLIIAGIYFAVYGIVGAVKEKKSQMIFLGLFSTDTGLWILIECHMMELFINNIQPIVYLSYITYGMMPVLFIRFMLSYDEFSDKIYINIIYVLGLIMNLAQIILAAAKVSSLFESQWMNRVYLGLTVIGLILALVSVGRARKNQGKRPLYGGIFILVVCTVLELGFFLFINKENSGSILRFGICLFILKSGIDLIKEGRMLGRRYLENEILSTMAYTDGMTHLGNRFAYDKEKARLESGRETDVIMMMADMNGLKKANDSYGHAYGDQVICNTAEILKNSFGDTAHCYRIGGDEFLVVAHDVSRAEFDKCIELMNDEVAKLQDSISGYGIATGIVQGKSSDIDDLFHEADMLMYKRKKEMKSSRV